MLKNLNPGDTFPDFELPDENGVSHRLSDLQGQNPMVVQLGRGQHCPRGGHILRQQVYRRGRNDIARLVRIEGEHVAADELARTLFDHADARVAVLERPRNSPA